MARRLLIATGNPHKLEELRALLEPRIGAGVELLCAADFPEIPEPDEHGETFEANALIKARAYHAATGLVTLADDSGLVIDALDGRPGVKSARYAETAEGRIARVLREMEGVPNAARTARFMCVMALCSGPDCDVTRSGSIEGMITGEVRGAAGFGYDPIFEVREDGSGVGTCAGRTLAELGEDEKNAISHRGRAVEAIAGLVAEFLRERAGTDALE